MPCESFFRDILGVSDGELLQELSNGATLRSISKGEHLMEMGDTQTKANFLVSGVVRCFSLDAEGRETTDCLISVPGSVLVPSADLSAPAPATVEMLTDGEVVCVPIALIVSLLETSLAANHLYIRLLSAAWHSHFEIRRVVSQLRTRERYLWFLDAFPGLIERIPNKYVASLLGMTPVTLSRLRSELREEKGARG